MANIQPTGSGNIFARSPNGAVQEKNRAGYNADTKKLQALSGPLGKNIEKMEQVENEMAQLPVPLDLTSPTLLKNVEVQKQPSVEKIESNTQGVKEFVSGNPALYSSFISSITRAQRTI